MTPQQLAKFWLKVDVRSLNECWPYLGSTNRLYGRISFGPTERFYAHRVAAWSLELTATPHGPLDLKACAFILHLCDNPPCCNPTHLEVGTHTKNMADAYIRGRHKPQPRGCRSKLAMFTEAQVITIRTLHKQGRTLASIAKEFNAGISTIHRIATGQRY